MLEAILKDLQKTGDLSSKIMSAADKVPVGAILDGLMLAAVAHEGGKTAGERSIPEALAKAKSDKQAGVKASQNAKAYLADFGIQLPMNTTVELKPSTSGARSVVWTPYTQSGGTASKIKVQITGACCDPMTFGVVIAF